MINNCLYWTRGYHQKLSFLRWEALSGLYCSCLQVMLVCVSFCLSVVLGLQWLKSIFIRLISGDWHLHISHFLWDLLLQYILCRCFSALPFCSNMLNVSTELSHIHLGIHLDTSISSPISNKTHIHAIMLITINQMICFGSWTFPFLL